MIFWVEKFWIEIKTDLHASTLVLCAGDAGGGGVIVVGCRRGTA